MTSVLRRSAPALLLVLSGLLAACGSSNGSGANGSTTLATAPPTSASPASALPTTTTAVAAPQFASTCAALADALKVEELQPKNTGNWALERQRIITDTAANAAIYESAKTGAPADLVTSLGSLIDYARYIGTSVGSADDFGAAVTAIGKYPDKVAASLATSSVDSCRRTNCR